MDLDPERGLKAGERWQEALKHAAERCELVLFLVSPEWARSRWCLAEFLLAKTLNKRIIGAIVAPISLADLPVEMTAEWQLVDLVAGVRDYTATVALPPDSATPGAVRTAEVALASDGLNRLRIGLTAAGLDPKFFAWPPAHDPDRPPFRGMRPLEAEDAGIFFGRDGAIVEALDRLRGLRDAAPPRLLVILGASGAGKSSFLRAGLLPRLARDDRHFVPLPVVRPERAAVTGKTGLSASLVRAFAGGSTTRTRAEVREAVIGGAATLRSLLAEFSARALMPGVGLSAPQSPKPPTLILPIDQGEELFTAEGADEAAHLLNLLRDLLVDDAPALTVVITIRSDGYERLQLAKQLERLRQSTLSLAPMPQGSYSEVILGPARRLGGTSRKLVIDDRLTQRLLADIEAGGAKDALPLLAFTLERLYSEYGSDGDLRLDEYERLGGITGAIEAAVERAFKAADTDARIPRDRSARLLLLRRGLIPWLAGIDPETRAPRRRVARLAEIPSEARPLVDHLVEQRLLSTDIAKDTGESTIEPAHEALLRQWGLLAGWLAEDAGALAALEGVKRAAGEWAANGERLAWLAHSGTRLEEAARVAARAGFVGFLDATELRYLASARAAELARARRDKWLNRAVRIAAVLALLGAGFAGWQWVEARNQATEATGARAVADRHSAMAKEAAARAELESTNARSAEARATATRDRALMTEARFLTDLSSRITLQGDATTGVLLALEAISDPEPGTVRPYLRAAVDQLHKASHLSRLLLVRPLLVHDVKLSPSGRQLLGKRHDFVWQVLNARTAEVTCVLKSYQNDSEPVFSGDGSRVVWGPDRYAIEVIDAETCKPVGRWEGDPNQRRLNLVAANTDASVLVGLTGDRVQVWSLADRRVTTEFKHKVRNWFGRLNPTGTRMLTAHRAGNFDRGHYTSQAMLWDLTNGNLLAEPGGKHGLIHFIQFGPDGRRVAVATTGTAVCCDYYPQGAIVRWCRRVNGVGD